MEAGKERQGPCIHWFTPQVSARARPSQAEARSSMLLSHAGGRSQCLSISCCLRGCSHRGWMGSRAARAGTGAPKGELLKDPLCHNASSYRLAYATPHQPKQEGAKNVWTVPCLGLLRIQLPYTFMPGFCRNISFISLG